MRNCGYMAPPCDERVVIDSSYVSAGGVDGSLILAALLRGDQVAKELQLYMAYEPQPPFDSGSPAKASLDVLENVRGRALEITERRFASARRYAKRVLDSR